MSGPMFRRDGVSAWWIGGGLYLEADGEGLLLDAPGTAADALEGLGALPRIRSVLLTSGRPRSVAGLVPLLCALERHRTDEPLPLRSCLGEERGEALANAWMVAWPGRYPLLVDGFLPGEPFDAGPFEGETVPVRHGEPVWGRDPLVLPAIGVAVRVRVGDVTIAWVPGAGPDGAVRQACRDVDLAVVEIGAEPWPPSEAAWRLTIEDALALASEAAEVWIVGDDGKFGMPRHRDVQ